MPVLNVSLIQRQNMKPFATEPLLSALCRREVQIRRYPSENYSGVKLFIEEKSEL